MARGQPHRAAISAVAIISAPFYAIIHAMVGKAFASGLFVVTLAAAPVFAQEAQEDDVFAAAEAAVGLAIIISIYRSRETIESTDIDLMKW